MMETKNRDYKKGNSNYIQANPTWHLEDPPWKAPQSVQLGEYKNVDPKTVCRKKQ